ncbi:MAG TPA: hypothetical protein VMS37_24835 [Verrucomicrobiae bacterium]|nr:hypothetical protein [Verrucomicrobiae bacterium]
MATGQPRPITVTLTYKFDKERVVSARPTISSLLKAKRLKKGTLITFKSGQGDVKLLLEPKSAFKPAAFQTGDDPVLVTKVPKKVNIWCGGKFLVNYNGLHKEETPVLPREIRITPKHNRLGVHGDDGN